MHRGPATPRGRISVAVPLYNHERFVTDAIESIRDQGALVSEIIVIDDGSTDGSARVMQWLSGRDERIRFRSQTNQGAHATLNSALAESGGEFIAILNSDDVFAPGRLERLAAALDSDPGADLAASAVSFMDQRGRSVDNAWYDSARQFQRETGDLGTALVNGNFLVSTSNFVIRRAALQRLGRFAALRYAHDLDFALRVLATGRRIAIVEQPLLRYRVHPANTIAEDHRRVRAEWAVAAAAYLTVLWDAERAPPIDWEAADAMHTVLLRHELTRAVSLCMAYLRRHGALPLDHSPLMDDVEFRARLSGWV